MGYSIYLFNKEVKEKNKDLSFLENENLIIPFTDKQFIELKERLIRYGYQIEHADLSSIIFNFKGGKDGIKATLSKKQLSFSSGFSENGIFEISQTASEFTDSGEFVKFDPQDGLWEETESEISQSKDMESEFDSIMVNYVEPLMKRLGYRREEFSFYKLKDGLIYLINFQKSIYSNTAQFEFFINCCIHSPEIDSVLGKEVNSWPEEHQCWYRERIEQITSFPLKAFSIIEQTDISVFQQDLAKYLNEAEEYMNSISGTKSLVDKMIEGGCNDTFGLLKYMVKTNQKDFIKRLVNRLYLGYSKVNRWPKIEDRINKIFEEHSVDYRAADLIE